jgi:prepilin-type N-terminal cleavage/methylation domain-containing protein
MAEDLMAIRNRCRTRSGQAGFSMIEMLMTAFVLAIGLLGLCMLQAMSLRASRGSRSLETAVQVAQGVLDQVEMEGRLSWNNLTDTNAASTPANLPNLIYIPIGVGGSLTQTFNLQGNTPITTSTDPTVSNPFFTAVTTHVDDVGSGGGSGQASDYSVTVTFADTVTAAQAPQQRQVTLNRRIFHG